MTPPRAEFFESRVRPLLVQECFGCHSEKAEKLKGGLRLDSRAALLTGGDSGPAVVPGNPEMSRLIQAVRYRDQDVAMPPKKRLTNVQVADLEQWVREGCPWPETGPTPATTPAAGASYDWVRLRREHWAFRPVAKSPPPQVQDGGWVKSAIDRFVLARLQAEGLAPAPPADRHTLIRRASLDLLGLPPTPEEVAAFVKDSAPDAFARVIDRMLASPRYGERWGRHWLDVARYSDGFGGFLDGEALPNAWRYRDWVVEALNQDRPYDQFLRAQIAGHLHPENRGDQVATGFFAIGPTYISDGGDPEAEAQARAETLADRVDTFSRAFLGLTVACARCHDHKFDPITTRDYYALAGIFNNTRSQNAPLAPRVVVATFDAAQAAIAAQERTFQEATTEIRERLSRGLMRESARYLEAWLSLPRPPTSTSREEFARRRALGPDTLDRWARLLADPQSRDRFPGLERWFELPIPAGQTEADGRLAAARRFQERIDGLLDQLTEQERQYAQALAAAPNAEARKKLPKPGLGKADQALLEALRTGPCQIDVQQLPEGADQQRLAALRAELNRLRDAAPPPYPRAHLLTETGTNDLPVAIRGDLRKPGEPAPRRFLQIVAGETAPRFREGSGLRELAEAVVDPANPLTARVIANRVWQHHFGQALVRTPSNLGLLGEKPTHPELLDWLAATLIEDGWSLKRLHRRILRSSSWQMSSRYDATAFARDGENRLLWRMNPRMLEVESWRDSHLAVTGELDPTLGGPPTDRLLDQTRRTLYATISRNGDRFASDEFFRLFDFPAPRTTSESRSASTVPQQYLFLLNSSFMTSRAQALARRVFRECDADLGRIERAYQLLYSRPPTAEEIRLAQEFLAGAPGGESLARWESYAQVLLSGHEFRQIE